MKLIGLSGKIGSGKSTITNILKMLNKEAQEKFFAEKLKKITAMLAGVDYKLTLSQEGKNTFIDEFNMTLGEMLQKIGTNALRDHFDTDVWVKSVFSDLKEDGFYIISDCRFPNEADAIKAKGGIVIRVNRPDNPVARESGRNLEHASETGLDNYEHFDYTFNNVGSYQNLVHDVYEFNDNILPTFFNVQEACTTNKMK